LIQHGFGFFKVALFLYHSTNWPFNTLWPGYALPLVVCKAVFIRREGQDVVQFLATSLTLLGPAA
jgi:hypothetical protein